MDVRKQIAEIDQKIKETEEGFAGTRGVVQDCFRLIAPILKDQQKVLTALAAEVTKKEPM